MGRINKKFFGTVSGVASVALVSSSLTFANPPKSEKVSNTNDQNNLSSSDLFSQNNNGTFDINGLKITNILETFRSITDEDIVKQIEKLIIKEIRRLDPGFSNLGDVSRSVASVDIDFNEVRAKAIKLMQKEHPDKERAIYTVLIEKGNMEKIDRVIKEGPYDTEKLSDILKKRKDINPEYKRKILGEQEGVSDATSLFVAGGVVITVLCCCIASSIIFHSHSFLNYLI